MTNIEWQGLDTFKRRLTTMKRRVKPGIADLLQDVSDASARAASKAAKGHRKTGRLQSSIRAHTTETTAGFSAVFYVKANKALRRVIKSAGAAAKVEARRGGEKFLRGLTK